MGFMGAQLPVQASIQSLQFFNGDIEPWIRMQSQRSISLLIKNIHPEGSAPGAVVASPSRVNPDYWFHWTRDAALVMQIFVSGYANSKTPEQKNYTTSLLRNYLNFSHANQLTPNPSGGVGEPKFNVDGSAFTGPWGRPQNDGPALRALTFLHWAATLIAEGRINFVREYLYDGQSPSRTVIKADLDYVASRWNEPDFDLWEEVKGRHFHTRMVQRRALLEGARLAELLGDTQTAEWYRLNALTLSRELLRHWNPERRILIANLDVMAGHAVKTSGLDTSVILGVLQGEVGDPFFAPTSDQVVSTAFSLQRAFYNLYSVNRLNDYPGIGIGRYPEDRYDGYQTNGSGNPWFLTTLAFAQYYFRLANLWEKAPGILVSEWNYPLLQYVAEDASFVVGTKIEKGCEDFNKILTGLRKAGDSFLLRVRMHMDQQNGFMSEQFNRDSGFMQGAEHLTWSYASFLTAVWERAKVPTRSLLQRPNTFRK